MHITFIIVIAVAIVMLIYSMVTSKMDAFLCGVIFNVCVIFAVILGITMWHKKPSPQEIDAYRNKTTLQITFKDSVAIDSVVVWKDNAKLKEKEIMIYERK